MSQKEKDTLRDFVNKIIELDLNLNCQFSTKNNDYEIVTYVDEVQVLDTEDTVILSVFKNVDT